jgi:hypothetical protein
MLRPQPRPNARPGVHRPRVRSLQRSSSLLARGLKATVDDHELAVCHILLMLVLERWWHALDQIEETVPTGLDVGAGGRCYAGTGVWYPPGVAPTICSLRTSNRMTNNGRVLSVSRASGRLSIRLGDMVGCARRLRPLPRNSPASRAYEGYSLTGSWARGKPQHFGTEVLRVLK